MVRANYTNLQKGVHETTEFLELFLRNLLLNERYPLLNRTMHISGALKKQDIESKKQDIQDKKQDIERIISAGIPKKNATNAVLLFEAFGFDRFFGRTEVMELLSLTPSPGSELLRKLSAADILAPVSGMGKGKYRFNLAFFRS